MSMLRPSLKYVLFCTFFLLVLFYLSFILNTNPATDFIFHLVVLGLFIFFAEFDFKSNHNGGYLHFWQGMTIGFYVYGISAVAFLVIFGIYFMAEPSVLNDYKELTKDFYTSQKDTYIAEMGEDGFESLLKNVEETTPFNFWLWAGLKKIIAGFFVTPVISIILRRKPK